MRRVGVALAGIFDVDRASFADAFGRRPFGVKHTLVDHPLLTLDAIADLADRFPGRIERHQADMPLVMPEGAPEISGPPSETVRGIDGNGCWMVFWYIEQVPEYKALLDQCLDEAESYLPSAVGRTQQREAFLFLSAPNALTPVHFDPEHNFLLQIRGHKDMHICAFPSRESARQEFKRYYDGGHRNLETLPSEGVNFPLDPSDGVYVPSHMPHWVQNGQRASISLSITFRTRASRRLERVERVNATMRRLRMAPQPAGVSRGRDIAKEAIWLAAREPKRRVSQLKQNGSGGVPPSA